MKYLNFKILLLIVGLTLLPLNIFGQQQNDNWIFGNNQWEFDEDEPYGFSRTAISDNFRYNSVSVSDPETGNLLFYTDGITVFDKNGNIMENGLHLVGPDISGTTLGQFYDRYDVCNGNATNQGSLILPKPGSPDVYYIITNVATNFNSCSSNSSTIYNFGIMYSEVNIAENNGLGKVETKTNLIQSQGNATMTATVGDDEESYWLVTRNGDNFYSYLIDTNGIDSSSPVTSFYSDFNFTSIKISPDGDHLAAYNFNVWTGGFSPVLFDFDNATGVLSNLNQFANVPFEPYYDLHGSPAGIEFSPDGNIIYYLSSIVISNESQFDGGLAMYNIATGESAGGADANNSTEFNLPNRRGGMALQRAQNGKIYAMFYEYYYNPSTYELYNDQIGVIENPNVWSPNTMPMTFVDTAPNTIVSVMFPQLIPESVGCADDLVITEDVLSGTDLQEANNTIEASNVIFSGATAIYHAGTSVTLKPGFHARSDSDFRAFIAGCSGGGKEGNSFVNQTTSSRNPGATVSNKAVILYPNPAKSNIHFESKDSMSSWEITNHVGSLERSNRSLEGSTRKVEIDISTFPTGIYFLKITFQDGTMIRKTVLKD